MCKDVYAVIWCWALGEVCHTFITYENEAIYVNIKFFIGLMQSENTFFMSTPKCPAVEIFRWHPFR